MIHISNCFLSVVWDHQLKRTKVNKGNM